MVIENRATLAKNDELSFHIPPVFAKEFAKDLRVVIRHPWIVGVPIPERLRPEVLKGLMEYEVLAVPVQAGRLASQDPIPPLAFSIPEELAKEFGRDLRVVIRHPWIVGIPVPERLRPEVLKGIADFEIIVAPKQY
jgi:hypothetical protein